MWKHLYCRYKYDWKREESNKNLLRTHTTAVSSRMLYALAQVFIFPSFPKEIYWKRKDAIRKMFWKVEKRCSMLVLLSLTFWMLWFGAELFMWLPNNLLTYIYFRNNLLCPRSTTLLIEFSEMKLLIAHILLNFIKLKVSVVWLVILE